MMKVIKLSVLSTLTCCLLIRYYLQSSLSVKPISRCHKDGPNKGDPVQIFWSKLLKFWEISQQHSLGITAGLKNNSQSTDNVQPKLALNWPLIGSI